LCARNNRGLSRGDADRAIRSLAPGPVGAPWTKRADPSLRVLRGPPCSRQHGARRLPHPPPPSPKRGCRSWPGAGLRNGPAASRLGVRPEPGSRRRSQPIRQSGHWQAGSLWRTSSARAAGPALVPVTALPATAPQALPGQGARSFDGTRPPRVRHSLDSFRHPHLDNLSSADRPLPLHGRHDLAHGGARPGTPAAGRPLRPRLPQLLAATCSSAAAAAHRRQWRCVRSSSTGAIVRPARLLCRRTRQYPGPATADRHAESRGALTARSQRRLHTRHARRSPHPHFSSSCALLAGPRRSAWRRGTRSPSKSRSARSHLFGDSRGSCRCRRAPRPAVDRVPPGPPFGSRRPPAGPFGSVLEGFSAGRSRPLQVRRSTARAPWSPRRSSPCRPPACERVLFLQLGCVDAARRAPDRSTRCARAAATA